MASHWKRHTATLALAKWIDDPVVRRPPQFPVDNNESVYRTDRCCVELNLMKSIISKIFLSLIRCNTRLKGKLPRLSPQRPKKSSHLHGSRSIIRADIAVTK